MKGESKTQVLKDNDSMYMSWYPIEEGKNGKGCRVTIRHMDHPCTSMKDFQNLLYKHTHDSSDEDEVEDDD